MKSKNIYIWAFIAVAISVCLYPLNIFFLDDISIASKDILSEPVDNRHGPDKDIQQNEISFKNKPRTYRLKVTKNRSNNSELLRIAKFNSDEYRKISLIKEHIKQSDYTISELVDELNNSHGNLSGDSLQELLFFSIEHFSTKNPQDTLAQLLRMDLENFFLDENSNTDVTKLLLSTAYAGFLKSGDSEIIKQVREEPQFKGLSVVNILRGLGTENALNWAIQNRGLLTDREFKQATNINVDKYKNLGRRKLDVNYNYALNWAKSFKKGSIEEAYALSNIAIQQSQDEAFHGHSKKWINDIQPGFARDRTTLGFALGASRFYGDETLEANLKKMYQRNQFNKTEAVTFIQDSSLPSDIKNELLELNESY